jgi:hypothetical protein
VACRPEGGSPAGFGGGSITFSRSRTSRTCSNAALMLPGGNGMWPRPCALENLSHVSSKRRWHRRGHRKADFGTSRWPFVAPPRLIQTTQRTLLRLDTPSQRVILYKNKLGTSAPGESPGPHPWRKTAASNRPTRLGSRAEQRSAQDATTAMLPDFRNDFAACPDSKPSWSCRI